MHRAINTHDPDGLIVLPSANFLFFLSRTHHAFKESGKKDAVQLVGDTSLHKVWTQLKQTRRKRGYSKKHKDKKQSDKWVFPRLLTSGI